MIESIAMGFFSGARPLLEACEWESAAFAATIRAAQAAISATGPENGHERWQEHQEFSRLAHEERARAKGLDLVVGVFDAGIAQELSLFSGYPENVEERICISDAQGPCVIGVGCVDMAHRIQPFNAACPDKFWDLDQDHDWGWTDDLGTHVEEYCAETRRYTRASMTGRTCYTIQFVGSYGYVVEPTAAGAINPLPNEDDPIVIW